jgi:ribosomal protein S4
MINLLRNQHQLKAFRRFREDIYGTLALSKPARRVINFLYSFYQINFLHKRLLIKSGRSFFLAKKERFVYKIVGGEKEFRHKRRSMKTSYYLMLLKLRRFYGNLGEQRLKRTCRKAGINVNYVGSAFIYLLEARLDVLLYRGNFFGSIFSSRQYVNHKQVYVNGLLLNHASYRVMTTDIVTVETVARCYYWLRRRLMRNLILVNYPEYLETNYSIGSAMLIKAPQYHQVPFPFFMNLKRFSHSFSK